MIGRHLLPHLVPLIIVYATLGIAAAILFEATLSFLGVGVPPPAPSWGGMIIEHVGLLPDATRASSSCPASRSWSTILAFNLLGDALADAFDPRHWR